MSARGYVMVFRPKLRTVIYYNNSSNESIVGLPKSRQDLFYIFFDVPFSLDLNNLN